MKRALAALVHFSRMVGEGCVFAERNLLIGVDRYCPAVIVILATLAIFIARGSSISYAIGNDFNDDAGDPCADGLVGGQREPSDLGHDERQVDRDYSADQQTDNPGR